MAWVACDKDGDEWIYGDGIDFVKLPKGSIKKLIGRELEWEDSPIELKEDE